MTFDDEGRRVDDDDDDEVWWGWLEVCRTDLVRLFGSEFDVCVVDVTVTDTSHGI